MRSIRIYLTLRSGRRPRLEGWEPPRCCRPFETHRCAMLLRVRRVCSSQPKIIPLSAKVLSFVLAGGFWGPREESNVRPPVQARRRAQSPPHTMIACQPCAHRKTTKVPGYGYRPLRQPVSVVLPPNRSGPAPCTVVVCLPHHSSPRPSLPPSLSLCFYCSGTGRSA